MPRLHDVIVDGVEELVVFTDDEQSVARVALVRHVRQTDVLVWFVIPFMIPR